MQPPTCLTRTSCPFTKLVSTRDSTFSLWTYIEGPSLSAVIREQPLPALRACEVLSAVARAVHYSHGQGTLHRDLKPSNVLFDRHDEPYVTDFGLAKVAATDGERAELTSTGQVLGTPNYMSPEQAAGKTELVGPASDVYSLGCVLYAALTGRPPLAAESVADTLYQVIHHEPVSARLLNPDVPKDVDTICLKCLQKEPHSRYGTAEELADDLDRFLQGRPVQARPIGSIDRVIRWCRRNRAVTGLLFAVTASLMLGAAISTWFAIKANQRAASEAQQRSATSVALQERSTALQHEAAARREAESARDSAAVSLERARWNLYRSQLATMRAEWPTRLGNLEQRLAVTIPGPDEPDFRGWEWYFFRRRSSQSIEGLQPKRQSL